MGAIIVVGDNEIYDLGGRGEGRRALWSERVSKGLVSARFRYGGSQIIIIWQVPVRAQRRAGDRGSGRDGRMRAAQKQVTGRYPIVLATAAVFPALIPPARLGSLATSAILHLAYP